MGLDYLKTKLLDYKDKWLYLENHDNPFAFVVMAHLKALETRKYHSSRKQWKIGLTKLLYQKGYSRTGVLNLYAFIDWVLALPDALEKIFLEDLREFEKEKKMPYYSTKSRLKFRFTFSTGTVDQDVRYFFPFPLYLSFFRPLQAVAWSGLYQRIQGDHQSLAFVSLSDVSFFNSITPYMKMILPPLEKGDRGGFFRWIASEIPPFSKGVESFWGKAVEMLK